MISGAAGVPLLNWFLIWAIYMVNPHSPFVKGAVTGMGGKARFLDGSPLEGKGPLETKNWISFRQTPGAPESQVNGCRIGEDILPVGSHREVGCGQLQCHNSNETTRLHFVTCDLASEDAEDGCTLQPQSSLEFPKCCERAYVCERIEIFEVPIAYNLSTIHKLEDINNVLYPLEEKETTQPMTQEYERAREKRQARLATETALTNSSGLISSCQVGKESLKIGEALLLRGCKQRKCTVENNHLLLVDAGCNINAVTPENCRVLPSMDTDFPGCCVVRQACDQVVMRILPIVVTAANFSLLNFTETNDQIKLDTSTPKDPGSMTAEQTMQSSPTEVGENRQPRAVHLEQTPGREPLALGCPLTNENQTLGIGESMYWKNCTQMKCVKDKNVVALVVFSCGSPDFDPLPQGDCKRVEKTKKNYPECCNVEYVCAQTVLLPVFVTAANVSEVQIDESDNFISSGAAGPPTTETSRMSFAKSEPKDEDSLTKAFEDDSVKKQRREEAAISTKRENMTENKEFCLIRNKTILAGQNITLQNCSRITCISGQENPILVFEKCDYSTLNLEEGCRIQPSSAKDYPKCCELAVVCTKVIENAAAPIVHPTKTLNELETFNATKEAEDTTVQRSENRVQSLSEERVGTRGEPNPFGGPLQIGVSPLFGSNQKEAAEYCKIKGQTLKIGETSQTEGCEQAECVDGADGPLLVVRRCDVLKYLSNGCKLLPTTTFLFPKCCVRVYSCPRVINEPNLVIANTTNHKNVLVGDPPLINQASSFEQSLHNVDNLSNSATQEDHRRILRKRETNQDVLDNKEEQKNTLEQCNLGNITLTKNESIPLKGCAQMTCTSVKEGLALVIISCNRTTSAVPQGCSIVPKPEHHYPECCVVELVCKMVVTEVIPVDTEGSDTNQLEVGKMEDIKGPRDKETDERSESTKDNTPGTTMVPSQSKAAEETVETPTTLNPRGKVKFSVPSSASNKRLNMYDYKEFIERSRKNVKPSSKSSKTKPTFILPLENSANKNQNRLYEDRDETQLTLEVNHKPDETATQANKPGTKDSKEDGKETTRRTRNSENKRHRRLSSLLLRNLTRNISSSKPEGATNSKSQPNMKTYNEKAKLNANEETTTVVPLRRQRVRNRYKKRNKDSEAARNAHRRRLYADRLNRRRTTKKPEAKDTEEEITPNERHNKTRTESEKEENLKKSTKLEKKEKRRARPKLIRSNFSRPRNRIGRRENKEGTHQKKKKESKHPPVRSRAKVSRTEKKEKDQENKEAKSTRQTRTKISNTKEEALKESAKRKPGTNLRFQRRRRTKKKDRKSKQGENEKKPPPEKSRKKVSRTPKRLKIQKVEGVKEAEESKPKVTHSRGNKVFNLNELRPKEVENQANRKRGPSRSQLLRERLRKQQEATDQQKTSQPRKPPKPEPVQILPLTTPHPSEGNSVQPISSNYDHYTEVPYMENFENTLEEMKSAYEFPDENLELPPNDGEIVSSSDIEENEIPDIPEVPIKVTTLTFSSSRRSFKSTKTRNTAKNFKQSPPVYESEETFKSVAYG